MSTSSTHRSHPLGRTLRALLVALLAVAVTAVSFTPAASAKPDDEDNDAAEQIDDSEPDGDGDEWDDDEWLGDYDGKKVAGSLYSVVDDIKARDLWEDGITGAGVQVALIDTGVAPVAPLADHDKVVAVVDLSLEAHVPEARYVDTFGHGTHMAGIIAGRSPGADPGDAEGGDFLGVAPDAELVSIKVGDNTGAVDVTQVIAAIDWVVQYGQSDGLNIRVINLSYGTDSTQDYRIDPLAHAVERAWHAGVVVVVAAGNEHDVDGFMANPAIDPYVLAVGDFGRKQNYKRAQQLGAERLPDVLAPGGSIESLVVPGSRVASENPGSVIDGKLLRGTGSSQAGAVVSGAVALLLEARPHLTPDEVKALLMSTTEGNGLIDVRKAARAAVPANATQNWERSTGLGSIEAARGTQHVTVNGVEVVGEVTVWGEPFDVENWAGASWSGASWSGASWSGASWSGASWSGASWSGASWSGASWSGASWSGASWSGASWSGASWSGASWSGASWSGASWSGASWSGASWSGASWSGQGWLSAVWT